MKSYKNLSTYRLKKSKEDYAKRSHIKKEVRDNVLKKYGGRCYLCGILSKKLTIDHIHPVNRGGSSEEKNLSPACASCNNFKMEFTIEELRREISLQVHRARKYSVNFRTAERFGLVFEVDTSVIFHFEKVKNEL